MIYALITFVTTIVLVAVDQGIKFWATMVLEPIGSMPLIPGIVELRYVLNKGAAFSMLSGKQGFLIAFTAVALLGILVYLLAKRPAKNLEYIAWLLVLSGGIGNLIDRAVNQYVVDYINLLFMDFAVFNFADILVCTGIGLLILDLLLDEIGKKKAKTGDKASGND